MNNAELDKLLHSAPVPEREVEYWEQFPGSVTRRLAQAQHSGSRRPAPRTSPLLLWGIGLATACIMIGFVVGWWKGHQSGLQAAPVAAMQKYYREIEALFPQQVRAIILDETGPHLLLADKANVPVSSPVLLTIQKRTGVQSVVTFSGQQIPVNGELCDVLTDADGHILLIGTKLVWSSQKAPLREGPFQIQARFLAQSP